MSLDVLEHLRRRATTFSGKFLTLANFVVSNHRRVAFMTARQLARESSVSLPTVVRFVSTLGFDGYQAFNHAMQERVNSELAGVEQLEGMRHRAGPRPLHAQMIERETQLLRQLLLTFPARELHVVAARLATAAAVAVVSVRYASPLAAYCAFMLRKLRPAVSEILTVNSVAYDDLALLPAGATLVTIGLARYPAELVEFLEFAQRRGLNLVAITDNLLSPVARIADHVLAVPPGPTEFFGYMPTAPTVMINALVAEVALRRHDDALARLETLEKVAEQRRTYVGPTGLNNVRNLMHHARSNLGAKGRRPSQDRRGKA